MQDSQNTRLVQDAYAAFGRGDIATLLGYVSDDVVWLAVYGAGPHVPTAGTRRGKAEVEAFFQLVGQHFSFSEFHPKEFVASGDKVVALGHYEATTSKQKKVAADFVMVFTVRANKIVGFQEFTDSGQINDAFR